MSDVGHKNMKISNTLYRTAKILFCAIALATYNGYVFADDLFIGKFASETRENFGPGKPGEIEVNVVRKGDKYTLSVFHNGEFKFDVEAVPCSPDKEGYLRGHPPGDVSALCNTSYGSSVFVYSQNGIKDPMADIYKEKGMKNPRVEMYYKPQYYGHIQWSFWGFRKVQ
jgi:hypothetical protein